jgi:hypothetical protein
LIETLCSHHLCSGMDEGILCRIDNTFLRGCKNNPLLKSVADEDIETTLVQRRMSVGETLQRGETHKVARWGYHRTGLRAAQSCNAVGPSIFLIVRRHGREDCVAKVSGLLQSPSDGHLDMTLRAFNAP